MDNKQIIWRTLDGFTPLPHKKQWRSLVERSESQHKKYPKWVKKKFSSHDLKHGFMKNNIFYRPLYMVTLRKANAMEGFIMPIVYDHEQASQMLTDFNEHPEHKNITFDLMLGGFMSYTKNEGGKL